MPLCAIGLGSNLGDREKALRDGVTALAALLEHLRVSSLYETEPIDAEGGRFLNAACVGDAAAPAAQLLESLKAFETAAGRPANRPRTALGLPRTLDLDLLLYGDLVCESPELTVPHPRLAIRAFVLVPLGELLPGLEHPVLKRSIGELLEGVEGREGVKLYKEVWWARRPPPPDPGLRTQD